MNLSDNYKRIQDGIANACARAKRPVDDVTLVAVTKYVPVERIAPIFELGVRDIGENRAQELQEKMDFFRMHDVSMHFIGQLQTNKVKYALGYVKLIQSVDRLVLAAEIERQAKLKNIVQDILVEVNIGEEAQKGGVTPDELLPFLEETRQMEHVCVRGLMCVPPAFTAEGARPYFAKMHELFEQCKGNALARIEHLSMGMSADFEVAIEEGATMVRIGSGLFGPRQYS